MSINEKLLKVQVELKAPKSQHNNFGNYNYRSCEDILESVKPLLLKNGLTLTISDEIVLVGDRFYVKATATVADENETISVSAYAREESEKKGMDASQVTGSSSSYARKYALNGLFAIDDTKDSDATNVGEKPKADYGEYKKEEKKEATKVPPTESQLALLYRLCRERNIGKQRFEALAGVPFDSPDLTGEMVSALINIVKEYPVDKKGE